MQIVYEHPLWQATIETQGGNVVGLYYKPKQLDLFRRPPADKAWLQRPFTYGNAPLFPPGRTAYGKFHFAGRTYEWPENDNKSPSSLHGFVWQEIWEYEPKEDGFHLIFSKKTDFGHDFRLTLAYRFYEAEVTILATVENLSQAIMPLALGFHTNFHLASGTDAELILPAVEQWELNGNLWPTGRRIPMPHPYQQAVGSLVLDAAFHLLDPEDRQVRLRYGGNTIAYEADVSFNQWVIYRRSSDSDFISLEPYTLAPNGFNLPEPASLTGLQSLLPQKQKQFSSKITLS